MPRDLADVLHHLIPELEPRPGPEGAPAPARLADARVAAATPILALPFGAGDVVRAAFAWNLGVEMARRGAPATLVAPANDAGGPWPGDDLRALGAEVAVVPARDLAELAEAVGEAQASAPQVILVHVPPSWLPPARDPAGLLDWTLLFTTSEPRELLETYGLAKQVLRLAPGARVGVTVHGARQRGEAARAFARLDEVSRRRLSRGLCSYGRIVDDLQVYRTAAEQRPVGLVHPQSPAARCLRDVAGLLLEDARVPVDA